MLTTVYYVQIEFQKKEYIHMLIPTALIFTQQIMFSNKSMQHKSINDLYKGLSICGLDMTQRLHNIICLQGLLQWSKHICIDMALK